MTDREYLQSLLDRAGRVVIPAKNPATGKSVYVIDEALVVRSHSRILVDSCTIRLADGVYSNIFTTPGAWDEAAPPRTVDVILEGRGSATLDGGSPNGLTERTAGRDGLPPVRRNTLVLFRNLDAFRVSGLHILNPRYWGMTFYYAAHGEITDIRFTAANNVPNQDGIDLRIGCHDIAIRDITGSTGDDSVALTALRCRGDLAFAVPGESMDVYAVTIEHIHTEVTGGHGIVRLLCHDGVKMHDITVRDVYDRLIDTRRTRCQAAVRIGDVNYWAERPAKAEEMYGITVDGVTTNAPVAVKQAADYPRLTVENVTLVP